MDEAEVRSKLAEVQSVISVPKNQRNNFGGYNYRNAEDILHAATPLLTERGLTLTIQDVVMQLKSAESYTVEDDKNKQHSHYEGCRVYVVAKVFINGILVGQAMAREEISKKGMDAAQVTGSASSYARKYALNGVFLLDDVKDADSMDNSQGGAAKQVNKKAVAKKAVSSSSAAPAQKAPAQKKVASSNTTTTPGANAQPEGDWKTFIVPFGRNKGKTLEELAATNPDEIRGLRDFMVEKYDPNSNFAAKNEAQIATCNAALEAIESSQEPEADQAARAANQAAQSASSDDADEDVPF